jgi:hypothetical protein
VPCDGCEAADWLVAVEDYLTEVLESRPAAEERRTRRLG